MLNITLKQFGTWVAKGAGLVLLIALVAEAQGRPGLFSTLRLTGTGADTLCIGSGAASPASTACTGGLYTGTQIITGALTVSGTPTFTTPVALTSGGTNASLTASNGGILYSTATAGAILAGTSTAGQMLRSGASTAPTWSTATYPATAGTSGNVLTSDGTNWSSATPTGTFSLLCSASGTNTTAAATNVATCAISGLTAKDSLEVLVTHSAITQFVNVPVLYNNTDSVTIQVLNQGSSITDAVFAQDTATIRDDQSATTAIVATGISYNTGASAAAAGTKSTFTTAWTGSWTLALRTGAGGVTAGGTYRYSWAVYKVLGQ